MSIAKRLIRFPFNILGLQIVNLNGYNLQQNKIKEIIYKANIYYRVALENKKAKITDPEYLQLLELKYGGYVTVPPTINPAGTVKFEKVTHIGGDRMNVFFHGYSGKYSEYLSPLKQSKEPINILEVGILKGTGLAVWSEYFDRKQIYGFDYNLSNFEDNKENLLELGAFKDGLPITRFFDQFADNSETLRETFGDKKLDVVNDDAFHSDESIIKSFDELQPYLAEKFVYFIEDNKTAWKKLQTRYPSYNFGYNGNQLTVVTRKH